MATELCRICLDSLNKYTITFNIFSQQSWDQTYAYKIMAITNIQINITDGLPECICSECAKKVDDSFILKDQIEESDEYLRSINFTVNNSDSDVDERCPRNQLNNTDNCFDLRHIEGVQDENRIVLDFEAEPYEIQEVTEELIDKEETLNKVSNIRQTVTSKSKDNLRSRDKNCDDKPLRKQRMNTQCPVCGKNGKSKRWLYFHMPIHSKKYKCKKCDEAFHKKAYLEEHIRHHKMYTCEICGKFLHNKTTFVKHMKNEKLVHNIKSQTDEPSTSKEDIESDSLQIAAKKELREETTEDKVPTSDSDWEENFPLKGGNFVPEDRLEEPKHEQDKLPNSVLDDGEFIFESDSQTRLFQCYICGKSMKTEKWLSRHIRRHLHLKDHEEEKLAECFICLKKFTMTYLRRHIHSVHYKEAPFKCEVCLKSFRAKDSLKEHFTTQHSTMRFHCPKCGKACKSKKMLRRHMMIHDGRKATKTPCNICGLTHRRSTHAHNLQIESEITRDDGSF